MTKHEEIFNILYELVLFPKVICKLVMDFHTEINGILVKNIISKNMKDLTSMVTDGKLFYICSKYSNYIKVVNINGKVLYSLDTQVNGTEIWPVDMAIQYSKLYIATSKAPYLIILKIPNLELITYPSLNDYSFMRHLGTGCGLYIYESNVYVLCSLGVNIFTLNGGFIRQFKFKMSKMLFMGTCGICANDKFIYIWDNSTDRSDIYTITGEYVSQLYLSDVDMNNLCTIKITMNDGIMYYVNNRTIYQCTEKGNVLQKWENDCDITDFRIKNNKCYVACYSGKINIFE